MAGPAKIIVWREEFVAARGGRFERSSGCKSRRCRRSDCCRQQPGQVRSRVAFRATRTVRPGPDAVKEVRDLTNTTLLSIFLLSYVIFSKMTCRGVGRPTL